ncbi:tRNA (adenosine(37)-N6)-dimethylallyltransferase MiaA [Vagococcus xieshaowenii]|uniref:tRNA dimethylallyltransferase n=1 Tax=Vagococcus xieshaowenii TaxID=2562451 RepID=A0AAJ5JMI0_9ENTE|nr:tRNA (adenosine(37)-N6)-dimethylallyltransferase MiaA [Vagococcus xieshaowenii]QCA29309.1 tRNA (adenosine(37)-N6)-dimethylallyltransferase MiaA [Vagococcus xieshaowenii]TFZ41996.1 tRNA (adenosine(37)-N6)-dimethylallyltransferase MiaA [Vagococcus xieshaowenii]
MTKPKLMVIVGPTAVGKTALSVSLAQTFNGEIISGDSLQVYQQLDIGTAKATKEEQAGIPHYLLDEIPLEGSYSASDFQQGARRYIEEIISRGKTPIIVGGTGLYIQSLLFDFELGANEGTVTEDEKQAFRDKWETIMLTEGRNKPWQYLQQIDPEAAAIIHENNTRRVIRAIELKELFGCSITDQQVDFSNLENALYDVKLIGLTTDRELLYERINQRVDMMMTQGLMEEVQLLADKRHVQGAQGIGYKEFFPYLDGRMSLEEAIEQVKQNSRRYAKRQLTWFRNRMPVEWWDLVQYPEKQTELEAAISKWLASEGGTHD